jgi:hypothetical protein
MNRPLVSRILAGAGTAGLIVGSLDSLEGAPIILAGCALLTGAVAVDARRQQFLAYWLGAFALLAVSLGMLFFVVPDFGGNTGHTWWWAVTLLPYPAGWLMSVVGIVRFWRRAPHVVPGT